MAEIELQDLIYQVKRELLAPNPSERAKDPYPLFYIDKIELEIMVGISQTKSGGLKLTVLDVAEIGIGQSTEHEQGHVVRVSLSPLESRDEILKKALEDPATRKVVANRVAAWVKSGEELSGSPE